MTATATYTKKLTVPRLTGRMLVEHAIFAAIYIAVGVWLGLWGIVAVSCVWGARFVWLATARNRKHRASAQSGDGSSGK
jgi:hypothetical protein